MRDEKRKKIWKYWNKLMENKVTTFYESFLYKKWPRLRCPETEEIGPKTWFFHQQQTADDTNPNNVHHSDLRKTLSQPKND